MVILKLHSLEINPAIWPVDTDLSTRCVQFSKKKIAFSWVPGKAAPNLHGISLFGIPIRLSGLNGVDFYFRLTFHFDKNKMLRPLKRGPSLYSCHWIVLVKSDQRINFILWLLLFSWISRGLQSIYCHWKVYWHFYWRGMTLKISHVLLPVWFFKLYLIFSLRLKLVNKLNID